ncbi:MAG: dTMP kinase [Clostridia bacterium]|nr:dTMP kinase [Clostridia bacterium]
MSNAKFIVFEGIDGCGKTTQHRRLCEALQARGREVLSTAEPTDSASGKMLRAALAGREPRTACEMAALFTLDRIHHNVGENGIAAALAKGQDVVSDRYYYSSLAYQGSLTDYEWVRRMNCDCPEIRRPDLCIFLDISPRVALERIGGRGAAREIYETEETLGAVRATFLRVFETLDDRVVIVDAAADPDTVAARVWRAVCEIL